MTCFPVSLEPVYIGEMRREVLDRPCLVGGD